MTVRLLPPCRELEPLVRAYVLRDTRDWGFAPGERRLNRYPALPLCSLNFLLSGQVLRQPFEAGATPRLDHPGLLPFPSAFVAGPNTRPIFSFDLGPVDSVTLAFHAPAFAVLTGCDPGSLVDRFVPAAELFGGAADALARTLRAIPDPARRLAVIETFLLQRWRETGAGYCPDTSLAGRLLARLSVGAAGLLLGWRVRTLERRFRRGFGLAPRTVRQLSRVEQAFLAARDGRPATLAGIAADCGYTDQSHMTRDFRCFSGDAPAQLLAGVEQDDSYWTYRL